MAEECIQCIAWKRIRNEERMKKLAAFAKLYKNEATVAVDTDDFTWMVEQIYKLGDEVLKLCVRVAECDDYDEDDDDV